MQESTVDKNQMIKPTANQENEPKGKVTEAVNAAWAKR